MSMQLSLDGFVEGLNGEMPVNTTPGSWSNLFEWLKTVDTIVLGRVMYPGYEAYWSNALSDPVANQNEQRYAQFASKTPHVVFSRTLDQTNWANTSIVASCAEEEVLRLKQLPGKDIMTFGGARLAARLIDSGLVDEYRLIVNPVLLINGKSLFAKLSAKRDLRFISATSLEGGAVILRYRRESGE